MHTVAVLTSEIGKVLAGVSEVDKAKHVSWKKFWNRIRARQIGNVKHSLYKLERRQYYESVDRYEEVGDHTFEVAIRYTQGSKKGEVVYIERTRNGRTSPTYGKPDEVDYINHIIIDVKASTANAEELAEIRDFYQDFMKRQQGLLHKLYLNFITEI